MIKILSNLARKVIEAIKPVKISFLVGILEVERDNSEILLIRRKRKKALRPVSMPDSEVKEWIEGLNAQTIAPRTPAPFDKILFNHR